MKRWSLSGLQWIGAAILLFFIVVAVVGPLILPHSPTSIEYDRLLTPSSEHWLGTNTIGQDIFARLVYGTRNALFVGLMVSLISTMLSAILGLASGYSKRLDPILNGLANMLLVLPSLLLILVIASFTGGSTWHLILTLGLLTWPGYMKMIRATVLSLKEREFVRQAQLYDGSAWYIMTRHLFPFISPLVRTKFIMTFRSAIAMEASLAFLGIGDANVISWGKLMQEAFSRTQVFLTNAWQWEVLPPAFAIMLLTIGLALLGEREHTSRRSEMGQQSLEADNDKLVQQSHLNHNDTSSQSAILVNDLSVYINKQPILKKVNLCVEQGEIVSILGSSGSGKTTFARALYGLIPKQQITGEITIQNKTVVGNSSLPHIQYWQDVAYVFQDARSSFNPLMKIGAQMMETIPDQIQASEKRKRVIEAIKDVQLTESIIDCYPHQLSGGMLSRALIALALINQPQVLIADEPTGALDPIIKREIFDLLISKVKQHQMTLVLITHDMPAALAISDRVLVIEQGKLLDEQEQRHHLQKWQKVGEPCYS